MSRIKSVVTFATLAVLIAAPLVHAQGASTTPAPAAASSMPAKAAPAKAKHAAMPAAPKLDLNSASREDLMKLPGVGDAIADKIIAARPFKSKSELTSKGIMGKKAYTAIASKIIAKQEAAAASTK